MLFFRRLFQLMHINGHWMKNDESISMDSGWMQWLTRAYTNTQSHQLHFMIVRKSRSTLCYTNLLTNDSIHLPFSLIDDWWFDGETKYVQTRLYKHLTAFKWCCHIWIYTSTFVLFQWMIEVIHLCLKVGSRFISQSVFLSLSSSFSGAHDSVMVI